MTGSEPRPAADASDELYRRASAGDAAAIESLLVRHLPGLRGFLARREGAAIARNESVADVAQSVCREVLAHLRDGRLRFRGEAEFKQWFFRAAVLKLADRRRYWAAGRDERADPGLASDAHPAAGDPSPSEDAGLREEAARFQRAFERLDPQHQEVIALHHLEGLSHAEIGVRLGLSESSSRARLARAMARLARFGAAG